MKIKPDLMREIRRDRNVLTTQESRQYGIFMGVWSQTSPRVWINIYSYGKKIKMK